MTGFPLVDNAAYHPNPRGSLDPGNTMRTAETSLLLATAVLVTVSLAGPTRRGLAQQPVDRLPPSASSDAPAPSFETLPAASDTAAGPQDSDLHSPSAAAVKRPTPPSKDCFFLNARSFVIPFTVDAAGSRPREVQLYASRGPTSAWKRVDGKPAAAPQREFQFLGQEDGEFWFATRTIDASGIAHPAGPITPQLKVYVDTLKPVISLDADADGNGSVVVRFEVDDVSPTTVQLRYITDTNPQWKWAAVVPQTSADTIKSSADTIKSSADTIKSSAGTIALQPDDGWQQISIQLLATDAANNQTAIGKRLSRPRVAETVPARLAANRTEGDPNPRTLPPPTSLEQIGNHFGPPSIYRGIAAQPAGTSGEILPAPSGVAETETEINLNGPQQSMPTTGLPRPETAPMPNLNQPALGQERATTKRPRSPAEALRPLNPADARTPTTTPVQTPNAATLPPMGTSILDRAESIPTPKPEPDRQAERRGNEPQAARKPVDLDILAGRVPVRYSDSVRFSLDFEIEAVGSAGVESIELYGSTDGGQTWKFWGEDPDRISPFDIETQDEGVFGFRIVVVGRNGLTSPRPLPGESPDIVVVVDEVEPTVRISGAQYGEGDRTGSLVIRYQCADANLMDRPITLSFSDSLDGPWTTIAAGLRNDGTYIWPADPGLPRQLYLRIDVKDRAGNVGTYILDRAINAQGLAPRARIRGFQPL